MSSRAARFAVHAATGTLVLATVAYVVLVEHVEELTAQGRLFIYAGFVLGFLLSHFNAESRKTWK